MTLVDRYKAICMTCGRERELSVPTRYESWRQVLGEAEYVEVHVRAVEEDLHARGSGIPSLHTRSTDPQQTG
jgi:hypothetical protein